jgi:hypothetical protein
MKALHLGRKRRIMAASVIVLLLAVLPNLLYVGHWPLPGTRVHELQSRADIEEHAAHCHLGLSHCLARQSLDTSVWIAQRATELGLDAEPRQVEFAPTLVYRESPFTVTKPPPRFI